MTAETIRSVCPYCGVGCGILLEVKDGAVTRVSGDKAHPTNFGRLCTKGSTSAQAIRAPGRLDRPYIRQGNEGDQRPATMAEAVAETGRRLRAILDRDGPEAIAFHVSGQMSLESQYLINKLAKGFVRTPHIESNSRLCMASAGTGYKISLGSDGPPGSYQDFDRADLFFVIGANMADCHPILYLRMMDRVKAGARLIVVDPRRTTTAEKAHLYLPIRPGTDLALLNGLLHLLLVEGHIDEAFIARFTEGWEEMPAFLADYTPAQVAAITGLAEADIRCAAAWIAEAPEVMSCWTMGLNQSTRGTWHTNAICNLHLATGKICRPGSGPFSLTGQPNAMGGREMGYMGPGLPGQRSALAPADRVFVEDMWDVPRGTIGTAVSGGAVSMFEEMRQGRIKACWIICTNPVASMPNRGTVIEALRKAEFVVTQDVFLDTETNAYADIMLPGALWAEAEGVMINSERNLTLMKQAVPPPGEAAADWKIVADVARAMGFTHGFNHESASEVFDELRRAWNPKTGYDLRGASYERLREGPLQWPCPPDAESDRNPIRYVNDGRSQTLRVEDGQQVPALSFATETGRAKFLPRPYLPPAEMPDEAFPFVLNTGRLQHQWHTLTKTGKIATLNKLNPGPFLDVHPDDAAPLGIETGTRVRVESRRGRATLPAIVTDRVRPGSVFAPFHWNDVFGEELAINAVTIDAVDPLSLQPELKFCAVSLLPLGKPPSSAGAEPAAASAAAPAVPAAASLHATEGLTMQRVDALATLLGVDPNRPVALEDGERLYVQGYLTALRSDTARHPHEVPILPVSAPIRREQRILVDGMLAGFFARTTLPAHGEAAALPPGAAAAPPETAQVVAVLWASQTGNAEALATRFADTLGAAGATVALRGLDAVTPADLADFSAVLIVTSTFGDGDPPDNAAAFWAKLAAPDAPPLAGLCYALLALGDPSYDQFCGFGRRLDARLEELGAIRLVPRADCDPDYHAPAQGWFESVSAKLAHTTPAPAPPAIAPPDPAPAAPPPLYTRKNPFHAKLALNRRLNGEGSGKDVRQIVFDLGTTSLGYEAGDALGVWPTNPPELVAEVIAAFGARADQPVTVKNAGEMPLADALLKQYEIARVTPDLLHAVQARAQDETLAALLGEDGKPHLRTWLEGRNLAHMLAEYGGRIDLAGWLAMLRPLQPRLYSIASSPKVHPHQVHLTMAAARFTYEGQSYGGVCSTFIADRAGEAPIPVFVQKSAHFRVPADPATPIIMIGPGTGIAPFRAFLQEREAVAATGRNWLFFGEQRAALDFYYRDELEAWQQSGVLTRLDTAFSRDQENKIYVQDRMREAGAEFWAWLEEGAHVYVCGDATRMAKDVDTALRMIVQRFGERGEAEAADYVAAMAREKRYLRDVY